MDSLYAHIYKNANQDKIRRLMGAATGSRKTPEPGVAPKQFEMHRMQLAKHWSNRMLANIAAGFFAVALIGLLAFSAPASDLLNASADGDLSAVKRALSRGAPLEGTDAYGETSISLAARAHHNEVVSFLLKKGASIAHADKFGMTTLHQAAAGGDETTIDLLIGQGARVAALDNNDCTPLMIAVNNNNAIAFTALLKHGARACGRDVSGMTPLFLAAWRRAPEICEALLSSNPDSNDVNQDGETPLMVAAANGDAAVVKILLVHGADKALKDIYGNDALAKAANHPDIEQLLKQQLVW
jgi:uncharacterized protein